MANKFNIHWQVVRVRAKKLDSPAEKIALVMDFLDANQNIHNRERVLNWLKTTAMGYRRSAQHIQYEFENAINVIRTGTKLGAYDDTDDMDNDFNNEPYDDVVAVYEDLILRKYNFQFKGKTPKSHDEFMTRLEAYLKQ